MKPNQIMRAALRIAVAKPPSTIPGLAIQDDLEISALWGAVRAFEADTLPRLEALRAMHAQAAKHAHTYAANALAMSHNKGANPGYREHMKSEHKRRIDEENIHREYVKLLDIFF